MKDIKVKCRCNSPLAKQLLVPNYTEEDLEEIWKAVGEGNIPARLALIQHNQKLMNDKLNILLKRKRSENI